MDVAESTVGTRGLTTIPIAIQKGLNLKEGDKIVWSTADHHAKVRKK